jgi:hypothetical protein
MTVRSSSAPLAAVHQRHEALRARDHGLHPHLGAAKPAPRRVVAGNQRQSRAIKLEVVDGPPARWLTPPRVNDLRGVNALAKGQIAFAARCAGQARRCLRSEAADQRGLVVAYPGHPRTPDRHRRSARAAGQWLCIGAIEVRHDDLADVGAADTRKDRLAGGAPDRRRPSAARRPPRSLAES